jgi:hypothetical protein
MTSEVPEEGMNIENHHHFIGRLITGLHDGFKQEGER